MYTVQTRSFARTVKISLECININFWAVHSAGDGMTAELDASRSSQERAEVHAQPRVGPGGAGAQKQHSVGAVGAPGGSVGQLRGRAMLRSRWGRQLSPAQGRGEAESG